jgi:hypothetical protein
MPQSSRVKRSSECQLGQCTATSTINAVGFVTKRYSATSSGRPTQSGTQFVNCEVKELLVPLPAADMDGVANTRFERVPQLRYLPPSLRGLAADDDDRREMSCRPTRAPVLPESPDGLGRLVPRGSDPDVPATQTSAEPKLNGALRAQREPERFRRGAPHPTRVRARPARTTVIQRFT